jgi:hypothetical protein
VSEAERVSECRALVEATPEIKESCGVLIRQNAEGVWEHDECECGDRLQDHVDADDPPLATTWCWKCSEPCTFSPIDANHPAAG